MEDEKGRDAKIICVLHGDPIYKEVNSLVELPEALLSEIQHFFDVYKMLEPDKKTSTVGYDGLEAALRVIKEAREPFTM